MSFTGLFCGYTRPQSWIGVYVFAIRHVPFDFLLDTIE